jgi:thiol:disulfide interchange protein
MLLVFGANWCDDCHVLDLAFQRPDCATVMAGYEVVHIDIGADGKKNADLVKQFDIPLNKGVPALAVAESDGTSWSARKTASSKMRERLRRKRYLRF